MSKKGSDKFRKRFLLIIYLLILNVVLASVMIYLDSNNGGIFHKSDKGEFIVKETYCTQDSDCVPKDCCHASACVNKDNAPKCTGIFCTQVCLPGTLDCKQGSCACVRNKCSVNFK